MTVEGQHISARFWYDGQYVNNAKEDAAEVALKMLTGQPMPVSTVQQQQQQQGQQGQQQQPGQQQQVRYGALPG